MLTSTEIDSPIVPPAAAGRIGESSEREPFASLEGVSRSFGNVRAVTDLSLTVEPGEVVALLGPNGAGKTTAVNLMLGLVRPDSGRAALFGGAPRDPANITRVGVMLQNSGVPETLRVWELIDQFSAYYPDPLPLAETVAAAGLEGLENRLFGRLSGGQRQRLLFAIALCGRPQLLFLDEPTVGLDVQSRRSFWQALRRFSGEGRSILLTTHYLEEADALADRIVVLDSGSVIAEGSPADIKRRTAGCRIRAVTSLTATEIEGWERVTSVRPAHGSNGSDSYRGRNDLEILAVDAEPVVLQLLQADPELSDLEVNRAALEDAFLALTEVSR